MKYLYHKWEYITHAYSLKPASYFAWEHKYIKIIIINCKQRRVFNYLFYYFPSSLIVSTFEFCANSVANVKYPVCPCISFSGLPVKMFALLAFCDITALKFRTSPVAGSVSVNLRGLGLDVSVLPLFEISNFTSVSPLLGNSWLVGIFSLARDSVDWSPAFSRSSGKLDDVY